MDGCNKPTCTACPVQTQVSSLYPRMRHSYHHAVSGDPAGGPTKIKASWTCGREKQEEPLPATSDHMSGIKVEWSSRGSFPQSCDTPDRFTAELWGNQSRLDTLSEVHRQHTVSTHRSRTYHGSAKTTFDPETVMSLFLFFWTEPARTVFFFSEHNPDTCFQSDVCQVFRVEFSRIARSNDRQDQRIGGAHRCFYLVSLKF